MRSVGGRHATQKPFRHVETETAVKVNMKNRPKKEWERVIKQARVNKTMMAPEFIVEH